MNRFQRLINGLPLVAVGAIALCTVTQRFGNQSGDVLGKPSTAQSQHMKLVPGSIYNGDTLRVTDGQTETKIRLCGIDAPEKEQSMGIAARDHLRSLVAQGNGAIIVVPVEKDRYGRTVAEWFVKLRNASQPDEEISLNAQMVADGFAYHYARYSRGCPNGAMLTGIEAEAIGAKLGVWKGGYQRP